VRFHRTPIDGLVVVELEPFGDERGWFARTFCAEEFGAAGLPTAFVQGNHSRTAVAGTVRGMHLQLAPAAEDKYVRCVRGAIFDVGVDLRSGSPTFGTWWGSELSAENGLGLLLPKGVAHGMQTLVDDVETTYLMSAPYTPSLERGVRHDDPAIGIEWPRPVTTVSDKDRAWPDVGPETAVEVAGGGR
jgi:dTDP-4-dehydrorhamnose 3,5-epimerase